MLYNNHDSCDIDVCVGGQYNVGKYVIYNAMHSYV